MQPVCWRALADSRYADLRLCLARLSHGSMGVSIELPTLQEPNAEVDDAGEAFRSLQ